MIREYIINLFEYIKNTYNFIYNNYNYKQIFLIILVFITIYVVEKISIYNTSILQILPTPPKLSLQPSNMNTIKKTLQNKENKSTIKRNKSSKRTKINKK